MPRKIEIPKRPTPKVTPRAPKASAKPPRPTRPKDLAELRSAFEQLWLALFSTPVHLDSALSKQPKHLKSALARVIQPILLRPSSLAQSYGLALPDGEPWCLSPADLARWSYAWRIAELAHTKPPARRPAALKDFPPHLISEWTEAWGKETARALVQSLGEDPPLSLRARIGEDRAAIVEALRATPEVAVAVEASELAPAGVRLSSYAPVMNTPLYKEGRIEIQDEGSQVMALFALWPAELGKLLSEAPASRDPKPEVSLPSKSAPLTVIDACAGAGGKSLALADALRGKGRVYAYDTSARKLEALRKRATRAGLNNIQTVAVEEGNETAVVGKFRRRADVVLVDAPCSGWGVLRRNPDIKWRQQEDDLTRMPELQKRILGVYSDLVAPGGTLVFGVCTFRPQETREVVTKFLAAHPDFTAGPGGYLGPGGASGSPDGFFMQSFRRAQKS